MRYYKIEQLVDVYTEDEINEFVNYEFESDENYSIIEISKSDYDEFLCGKQIRLENQAEYEHHIYENLSNPYE